MKEVAELAVPGATRLMSRLGVHPPATDDFVARHLRFNQMVVDSGGSRSSLLGSQPFLPDLFHHLRVDRPVLLHEVCEQAGEAIVLIPVHAADFLDDRVFAHGSPPSS